MSRRNPDGFFDCNLDWEDSAGEAAGSVRGLWDHLRRNKCKCLRKQQRALI